MSVSDNSTSSTSAGSDAILPGAMTQALEEKKMCAIVRIIYRKTDIPYSALNSSHR